MRQPQSRCKSCRAAAQRENREPQRAYDRRRHVATMADPGRRRRRNVEQRELYAKWRDDPEWYGVKLEQSRESKRRARATRHDRHRSSARSRALAPPRERAPAAPLAGWLERQAEIAGGKKQLAIRLGMGESVVRRIIGATEVDFATVDAVLTAAGAADALHDLYPLD